MKHLNRFLATGLLTVGLLFGGATASFAADNERNGYVRLGLGFAAIVETEANLDSLGFTLEFAAAPYLGDYFAIEGMLSVSRGKSVSGFIEELFVTGMANVYFIPKKADIQPFIGLGVGWGHQNITIDLPFYLGGNFKVKTTDFAWNASAGMNFFLTDNTSIGVGYRFFAGKKISEKIVHTAFANLSYNF